MNGQQQFYPPQQQQQQQNGWPTNRPFNQANGFSGGATQGYAQFQQNNGYGVAAPPPMAMTQYMIPPKMPHQNGVVNGFGHDASNFNQAGYVSKGFGGYNNTSNEPTKWMNQVNGSDSMEKQLFHRTNSGINFDNYENIPVDVSGENPPQPINEFADASLHDFIKENVEKSGYSKPTPVQKHSIPTLLANRDLMSCAQTGSGKTAAFLLPIINHILVNGPEGIKQPAMSSNGRRKYFPSALVLSPTRELAIQIHKEAAKFSYRTNIVTAILYGGRENYREQVNRIRNGCHILIATPGRLIDVLNQEYIGLDGCRYLVLDEADRMLDMGFEPQIRKIVNMGMPDKQNRTTAMFSATFPKEIQILAKDFLKNDYVFLAVGRVGSTSENIEQRLNWVEEVDKRRQLMSIVDVEEPSSLMLVFVETKRGANELAYYLNRQNVRSVAIHGDLKQFERERNLEFFRSGEYPVLVATAVAARGLDIPNVRHVVNYDLPGDIDEYVHRIGRTGRCGNLGRATSFFNDKNRGIGRDMMQLVQEANQDVPDWLRRVAAEGRVGGPQRGNNRRFGGVDHRRGGGARGGGNSFGTFMHTTNGFSSNSNGFSNGYAQQNVGFSNQRQYQQSNGFGSAQASVSNGYSGGRGGFVPNGGMGRGGMVGFNNGHAVSNGFGGSTWQARGGGFVQHGGGFSKPQQQQQSQQQQNGFDHWQAPRQ